MTNLRAERLKDNLAGFRRRDAIPPVQVVRLVDSSPYTHRLFNGAHRFHFAVAAGYSHVPTVEVRSASAICSGNDPLPELVTDTPAQRTIVALWLAPQRRQG